MRVPKVLKIVLIGVPTLLIALIVGAVVTLKYTDFNQYKPLIVEEVRKATGRDLAISGDLRLDISFTLGIVVDGVTLSNAEWGSRPDMVSVRRLEAQIALTSLMFGVLEVKRIELTGADILLETDRQGHANFEFMPLEGEAKERQEPEEAGAGIGAVPLVYEAEIRDSRLTYVSAATGATYSTVVDSLMLRSDGLVESIGLVYVGNYNSVPVQANARLGTPAGLLERRNPWPVDLTLKAGGAVVTIDGTIAEPLTAGGFDLAIAARGDRLGDVSRLIGAEIQSSDAYSISARVIGDAATAIELAGLKAQLGESKLAGEVLVKFAGEQPTVEANLASDRIDLAALGAGVDATLQDVVTALSLREGNLEIASFNATVFGATVTVKGTIAEPLEGRDLDLAVTLKGDQIGDLSELTGAEVPALGAYSLSARVTGDPASTITLAGLKAQLGDSDVAGEVTLMLADEGLVVDARLASRKIDLAALGAGVDVPLQEVTSVYSVKDGTLNIESFKANLSGANITVTGQITDPAEGKGLDLAVEVAGDQTGDLSELAGAKVPALGAYSLSMRVNGDPASTITLAGLKAQLGDSDVAGEVTLMLADEGPLVDARLASRKIDLAALGAGVDVLLQEVTSVYSVKDGTLNIESFKANLSGANITVTGQITDPAEGKGLDLAVEVAGDQTGDLSELAGVQVPALGAYSLSSRVTGDAVSVIKLDGLKAQFGASDLAGEATVTLGGETPAFDANLASRQIDLAALGAGVNAILQDTVTTLALKDRKLDIRSIKTNLAGAAVTVNGTIADAATFEGLDLAVAARGDRFQDLSEQISGKGLALGGYSLAGRVTGDLAAVVNISELAAQVGDSDISGSAQVKLSGKHPAIDARLASGKIDLAALGVGNAPLRGTVAKLSLEDEKLLIESIEASLSGATIMVEGTIAEPVKASGLDLSVAAKGEQFGDLSELVGREMPALGSYEISTRVTGDATTTIQFSEFTARVGGSDLAGNAAVTLTGERPFIDAGLSSNEINLAIVAGAAGDADRVEQQEAAKKPDRIFPDDPLPLEGLNAIDADLRFDAATVTSKGPPLRNAVVILSLRSGLLNVESLKAELYEGALDGALQIDGRKETAGLIARAAVRKVDLPMLEETVLAGAVEGQVNLDLDVTGQGNSIREIMASLDGKVTLAMGRGRIQSRALQILVGGPRRILSNVLTLNVGGYTAVNCALGVFDIKQGLATTSELLLDTDVAAFVGKGTINLGTEALDMIINPEVKKMTLSAAVPVHVRGTLANPEYSPDSTAVARRVGGLLGGLVFPPALILGLGELGTFEDGDCAGRAKSADGKTTPEQAEPATDQQPAHLPGKIIKGTGETITKGLKGLFGQ